MIVRLVVDEGRVCLRMFLESIRCFCIAPYCPNYCRFLLSSSKLRESVCIFRVIGIFTTDFIHSGGAYQSVCLSAGYSYLSAPFAEYFGALSLPSNWGGCMIHMFSVRCP